VQFAGVREAERRPTVVRVRAPSASLSRRRGKRRMARAASILA
jgi:hypothetical protein